MRNGNGKSLETYCPRFAGCHQCVGGVLYASLRQNDDAYWDCTGNRLCFNIHGNEEMRGRFVGVFVCLTTIASPIENAVLTGFKYRGNGYLVQGERAVKKGDIITVEQAKVILDDDDIVLITTPRVKIDVSSERASGFGKVKIRTRKFILTGNGFDFSVNAGKIAIRRDVRILFFGSLQ